MVKITDDYVNDVDSFIAAKIKVPSGFDFNQVQEATRENPVWVHFGGGNLFRCMQATQMQQLLSKGLTDKGIILAVTWDDELIGKIYNKYKNRSLNVILKGDGSFTTELINSVTEAIYVSSTVNPDGFESLKQIFENPSLQLATLTVTEKAYNIKDLTGNFFPPVAAEIEAGPVLPQSLMGILASALFTRFRKNASPIAICSADNFSHNGDKLKASILEIARGWLENGFVENDFIEYLLNTDKVAFPLSMIDRITPGPSPSIAKALFENGFEDVEIIKTSKHSASAAFVNTEETNCLVIEDSFPNGRPPLEKAGVIFTSRNKVDQVEHMKVCTCLNPLHTALAILGCLLGFDKISEEVKDEALLALIKRIGYVEGLPVVTDPGIISPKDFLDEVINKRLPNPYLPDTPQRIATDTSQKIPIRFGVTMNLYYQNLNLDVKDLDAISFTLAAWLRYLMAIDDYGNAFKRSLDPMLVELDPYFEGLELGSKPEELEKIRPILKDANIFGVDLEAIGLADKIFKQFVKMAKAPGEVRELLEQVAFK